MPKPVWVELSRKFRYVADEAVPLYQLGECQQCRARREQEQILLQRERDEIASLDSNRIGAGQAWFLVDAGWLKHWREYCWDQTRTDPPGPVCNWRLFAAGGKQPRPNLQRARDYRGVNYDVWRVFIHRYGGQPAICRYELNIYADAAPIPAD